MSARLTSWISAGLLVAWLASSSNAEAQAWLADRKRAEGIGIRTGNLEIHPGVGAEIGYDSNVFLADANPTSSAILRVTPHLFLSTLGEQRMEGEGQQPDLEFRLGTSLPILYYTNGDDRTRVEANADLAFQLLPGRPVSFAVDARYNRTERPFVEGPADTSYGRNTITVLPGINFQTVGGVLRFGVGGSFNYDFFDSSEFGIYDTMSYAGSVKASWEFLPKTALIYEGEAAFRSYEANSTMADMQAAQRYDGSRWMFRAGVNGALSARLSATLLAGYTAAFFDTGSDKDAPTLSAELRWKPSETVTTKLGYDRTLTAAFQGNFHTNDRVGAQIELLAGGAFLMSLGGYFTHVRYGSDAFLDGDQGPRRDNRLSAELSGEYRFTEWLALTAHTALTMNFTEYEFPAVGTGTSMTTPDAAEFTRFDAFLGMRLFY